MNKAEASRSVKISRLYDPTVSLDQKLPFLREGIPSLQYSPIPEGSRDLTVILPGNTNGISKEGEPGLLNSIIAISAQRSGVLASSFPHQERNEVPTKMQNYIEQEEAQQRTNALLQVAIQGLPEGGTLTIVAKSIGAIKAVQWLHAQDPNLRRRVKFVVLGYPLSLGDDKDEYKKKYYDPDRFVLTTECARTTIVQGTQDKYGSPEDLKTALDQTAKGANVNVVGVSGGHSYDEEGKSEIIQLIERDFQDVAAV